MSVTGIILLVLIGPGIVFLILSGKYDELKSPSGWLLTLPMGLLFGFFTTIYFAVSDDFSVVANVLHEQEIFSIINFGLITYLGAFFTGAIWRTIRMSRPLARIWLYMEKHCRGEGDMFVSRNLLEHFIFCCYAVGVTPEFCVLLESAELRGKCIKYQWNEPRSILLLVTKEDNTSFVFLPLTSIKAIYVLNWSEIKNAKQFDEWKYIRLIDPRLPDLLRGKKDGCGKYLDSNDSNK